MFSSFGVGHRKDREFIHVLDDVYGDDFSVLNFLEILVSTFCAKSCLRNFENTYVIHISYTGILLYSSSPVLFA